MRIPSRFPWLGRLISLAARPAFLAHHAYNPTPRTRGIIRSADEVLLVRNWISSQEWTLPGGGVKRSEPEAHGMTRELEEEVGIIIPPDQLTYLTTLRLASYRTPFDVSVYRVHVSNRPAIHLSLELLEARWFPLDHLPATMPPELAELVRATG